MSDSIDQASVDSAMASAAAWSPTDILYKDGLSLAERGLVSDGVHVLENISAGMRSLRMVVLLPSHQRIQSLEVVCIWSGL